MKKTDSIRNIETPAAVVGGGASGLLSAIFCARTGAEVLLLEQSDCPGKKLLRTGNGRCNYTNEQQGASFYPGTDPSFVHAVFSAFGPEDVLAFFREIGIYPRSMNGYYYPYSMRAKDVAQALETEAVRRGVIIRTGTGITGLRKDRDRWILTGNDADGVVRVRAQSVILACGSPAGLPEGTPDSAAVFAEALGLSFLPRRPVLTGLLSANPYCRRLHGTRARGAVSLRVDGETVRREEGEIQFTDYGLSGIAVFNLSHEAGDALQKGRTVLVDADLMPELSRTQVTALLLERRPLCAGQKSAPEALLSGLLAPPLIDAVLSAAGVDAFLRGAPAVSMTEQIAAAVKQLPFPIVGLRPMKTAQAAAGGIRCEEVSAESMECRRFPGLFLAGEMLDVDGLCGGYNLQWAWSSGALAGIHAAQRVKPVFGAAGQEKGDVS